MDTSEEGGAHDAQGLNQGGAVIAIWGIGTFLVCAVCACDYLIDSSLDENPQHRRYCCPTHRALGNRFGAVETEAAVTTWHCCVIGVVIQADGALGGGWLGRGEWLGLGRLGLLAVGTLTATRRSCNGDKRLHHDSW